MILKRTEEQLLKAISAAAQNADLEQLDKARWVLGQVQKISDSIHVHNQTNATDVNRGNAFVARDQPPNEKKSYPIFQVRNGTLYRTAWSRKKNAEYEHKVPKQTVDQVIQAMARVADTDSRPITVEAILSTANSMSVLEIPQYQAYLVISWLRYANCIDQIGRDGYRIPVDISTIAERKWQQLSPGGRSK